MHEPFFFFSVSSKCVQTSNLPFLGQPPFVTGLFFYAELTRHLPPSCLFDIFSWARLDLRPSRQYLRCLFWAHRASFPRDLDWLLKVKALSTFLSSGYHTLVPDAWHYDTAATFQEKQCLCLSLISKLLCMSLISLHINTLSICTLSLSCCYPLLSCNIQHIGKVFEVDKCVCLFL